MRQEFIIGGKTYAAHKIAAFAANGILMKLQKIILPALGSLAGGKSLMEMNVNEALQIISEKLDESVMTDIILPMFIQSQVVDVEGNFKIDSSANINKAFGDADGLANMYELIFEVMRFNFGAFFISLKDRFGSPSGALAEKA